MIHRPLNPITDMYAWCGGPGPTTNIEAEITCPECAAVQLYGGEIETVRHEHVGGGFSVHVEHVGPDLHDQIPYGGQCRCGWLSMGIVRTFPVTVLTCQMRGGEQLVRDTLAGLPGDHVPEHVTGDIYRVVTNDPGFLRFALTNQGYGTVIDEEFTLQTILSGEQPHPQEVADDEFLRESGE